MQIYIYNVCVIAHKLSFFFSNGTNIDNDFARTFEGQFEISVGDDMTEVCFLFDLYF